MAIAFEQLRICFLFLCPQQIQKVNLIRNAVSWTRDQNPGMEVDADNVSTLIAELTENAPVATRAAKYLNRVRNFSRGISVTFNQDGFRLNGIVFTTGAA